MLEFEGHVEWSVGWCTTKEAAVIRWLDVLMHQKPACSLSQEWSVRSRVVLDHVSVSFQVECLLYRRRLKSQNHKAFFIFSVRIYLSYSYRQNKQNNKDLAIWTLLFGLQALKLKSFVLAPSSVQLTKDIHVFYLFIFYHSSGLVNSDPW